MKGLKRMKGMKGRGRDPSARPPSVRVGGGNNGEERNVRSAGLTDTEQAGGTPVEHDELECFLLLAEELHFGRTAERMRLSRARVSQLVQRLERRVGGPTTLTEVGSTTRLQAGKGRTSCVMVTPSGSRHSGTQNHVTHSLTTADAGTRWNSGRRSG
jgi:hypothetical protein